MFFHQCHEKIPKKVKLLVNVIDCTRAGDSVTNLRRRVTNMRLVTAGAEQRNDWGDRPGLHDGQLERRLGRRRIVASPSRGVL